MRSTKDAWYLELAALVAKRSTCQRRAVGCVLINDLGHILATGYNGVARDLPHCNENNPCPGVDAPSGTDLDGCQAIHAETNALLQCGDVEKIWTCYVTVSPCISCVKMLMNTACQNIIFSEEYAHHDAAKNLWLFGQRVWRRYP